MTAFFQSPFLSALGWALANSLWQMAFLWLLFQLCFGTIRKIPPRFAYLGALVFMLAGFTWFIITFVQQYSALSSISRYLVNLPTLEDAPARTVAAGTGDFTFGSLLAIGEKWLPYLSASYLIILVILFIRLINAYGYSQEVKQRGLVKVDFHWRIFVKDFANRIGIRREVAIYLSELIDVPATMGWLKPVILLPLSTFTHLSPQQVEAVILHELSHIKRNDYLVNLLISVVETILFFNPFCQLLASSVRKERENCCDDFVIQLRCDPGSYAAALLSLERMRISNQQQLAIAATGNQNQLLGRVKRILNVKTRKFNYGQKLTALLLTAFVLSSFAWLSPEEKPRIENLKQPAVALQSWKETGTYIASGKEQLQKQKTEIQQLDEQSRVRNWVNFDIRNQPLTHTDWEQALQHPVQPKETNPGFFTFQGHDSFFVYSEPLLKSNQFKISDGDLKPRFLFGPGKEKRLEGPAELIQDKPAEVEIEQPGIFYAIPPGPFFRGEPDSASDLLKYYSAAPVLELGKQWQAALDQLKLELNSPGPENEKLKSEELALIRAFGELNLSFDQRGNDPKDDAQSNAGGDQQRLRDTLSQSFGYRFQLNNEQRKAMNVEYLKKLKTDSDRQLGELDSKMQEMQRQRQVLTEKINRELSRNQAEAQKLMSRVHDEEFRQYFESVHKAQNWGQEYSEQQARMLKDQLERKVKADQDSHPEEWQRTYNGDLRTMQKEQEKFLQERKLREMDHQKQSDEIKMKRKKMAESEVVLSGSQSAGSGNGVLVVTASSAVKSLHGMQVVFMVNKAGTDKASQVKHPVILHLKTVRCEKNDDIKVSAKSNGPSDSKL